MNQYTARFSYCDCMGRLAFSSLFAICILAGCTEPNPSATCGSGTCIDPAYPYCDADGLISGTPGVCVAVSCMPGEVHSCTNGNAVTCNSVGNGYDKIACDLDCLTSPKPHCAYIEPRYLSTACDAKAESDLEFDASGTFDPNLDVNCTGGVVEQPGAVGICVVHNRNISIGADATISVSGRAVPPGRAIAFVADNDLVVDGTLDVGAHGTINGPGGGVLISGGRATFTTGGGGAGGKTDGGAGATRDTNGGAANGGAHVADPATLAAFVGGASAYKDPQDTTDGFGTGGGGGALTLVSCHGAVRISGAISAGGGAGPGGGDVLGGPFPGGGGGAGGYVVLQGVNVTVDGGVFANGGSGGCGAGANNEIGRPGYDGAMSTSPVSGGMSINGGGCGGSGGALSQSPTGGQKPSNTAAPGGGGGSVGFLQIYTPRGVTPTISSSNISPAFQPHANVPLR